MCFDAMPETMVDWTYAKISFGHPECLFNMPQIFIIFDYLLVC